MGYDRADALFYAGLLTIKFSFRCVALHGIRKQPIRRWVVLGIVILESDDYDVLQYGHSLVVDPSWVLRCER